MLPNSWICLRSKVMSLRQPRRTHTSEHAKMLIFLKHANDVGAAGPSLPGFCFPSLFTKTAPVNFDTMRSREWDREKWWEQMRERQKTRPKSLHQIIFWIYFRCTKYQKHLLIKRTLNSGTNCCLQCDQKQKLHKSQESETKGETKTF